MTARDRWLAVSGVIAGIAVGLVAMNGLVLLALSSANPERFIERTVKIALTAVPLLVVISIIIRYRVLPPGRPLFGRTD